MTTSTRSRRHITLLPRAALLLLSRTHRYSSGKSTFAFAPTTHLTNHRPSTQRHVLLRGTTKSERTGTKWPLTNREKTISTIQRNHVEPNDEVSKVNPNNYTNNYTYFPLPDFMQKDPMLLTDKRIIERKLSALDEEEFLSSSSNQNNMEMMAMSAVSLALAFSVVYSLASSTPDVTTFTDSSLFDVANFEGPESESAIKELLIDRSEVSRFSIATRNVAMTVLPQSADDVIAVSIGEGLAGAISNLTTWVLGMLLGFRRAGLDQMLEMSEKEREKQRLRGELVSGAVADGDYFLTRAAAQPLFEAMGLPIFVASLASILLATLPYQAIKLSSQKKRDKEKERVLLEILLQEEELRQKNMNIVDKMSIGMTDFFQRLSVGARFDDDDDNDDLSNQDMRRALMEDQKQRLQEMKDAAPKVDYIEFFADVTKWLEYDVLINNYRGILATPDGHKLSPGLESAIFGLLASLSSQLYTDVLYIYSDFGNPEKRKKTLNRSLEGWASLYATKCLSAATLFGTYEAIRAPISRVCSRIISGGYTGCVGSADFDLCMETYLIGEITEYW
ncbi:hypothetical protein HJC23_005572 [Cyclotella cryptica]|uniref:Uncharacterized protein n=1 Tax=Cyclotella cryptica TaxID=29204 RepID=A0ABD3PVF2_9STRA